MRAASLNRSALASDEVELQIKGGVPVHASGGVRWGRRPPSKIALAGRAPGSTCLLKQGKLLITIPASGYFQIV